MSARSHPIDAVEDLWSIFECPDNNCGMLTFSEEILQRHIAREHPDKVGLKYFSVDFIRAVPQDEKAKN